MVIQIQLKVFDIHFVPLNGPARSRIRLQNMARDNCPRDQATGRKFLDQ